MSTVQVKVEMPYVEMHYDELLHAVEQLSLPDRSWYCQRYTQGNSWFMCWRKHHRSRLLFQSIRIRWIFKSCQKLLKYYRKNV